MGAACCAAEEDGIGAAIVDAEQSALTEGVLSGAPEVHSWKVVSKTPFPVHSSKATDAKVLGTKKSGTSIRGHQEGEWVKLFDEPGYMRITGAKSGNKVLEKEAEPAEELRENTVSELAEEWRMISKMPNPVFADKVAGSKSLCIKKPNSKVRGVRDGDWLMLVDEPGFMRIVGAKSGNKVLEREEDYQKQQAEKEKLNAAMNEAASAEEQPSPAAAATEAAKVAAEAAKASAPAPAAQQPGDLQDIEVGGKFSVAVVKAPGSRLGVDVETTEDDRATLRVDRVNPTGLIGAWNRENPKRDVRENDRIVEVNGVNGDSGKISTECKQSRVLVLTIRRGTPMDQVPQEPEQVAPPMQDDRPVELNIGFRDRDGNSKSAVFVRRPLGLDFKKSKPLTVLRVHPNSDGENLGVEPYFQVISVNGEDVSNQNFDIVFTLLCNLSKMLPQAPKVMK